MLELATVVPYFDLSLQHADPALLRAMKRWGSGDRFLAMIDVDPRAGARRRVPVVVHRRLPRRERGRSTTTLLDFLDAAELDWAGFFAFSPEDGTAGGDAARRGRRPSSSASGCASATTCRTRSRVRARDALVGTEVDVLVDGHDDEPASLIGRTHREAPEIDGVVRARRRLGPPGRARAAPHVTDAVGPDLVAKAAVSTASDARATRAASAANPVRRRRFGAERDRSRPRTSSRIARLLLAVPTLLLITDDGLAWLTVALWFVLACTDRLDGWLARRDGTTRSGAFLDPLADKFLVIGGLRRARHPRRLLVGGGRHRRRARGRHLGLPVVRRRGAASRSPPVKMGKWKAFFQFLAVGVVLFPPTYELGHVPRHRPVDRGRADGGLGPRHPAAAAGSSRQRGTDAV